jgi:hypothetical protein
MRKINTIQPFLPHSYTRRSHACLCRPPFQHIAPVEQFGLQGCKDAPGGAGGTVARVFVIAARRSSRLHRDRQARLGDQLLRGLVQANRRTIGIARPGYRPPARLIAATKALLALGGMTQHCRRCGWSVFLLASGRSSSRWRAGKRD